jgi:hypothetical protein
MAQVNKKRFAAFAKSQSGGKNSGKGKAPPFGKKPKDDDEDDRDEHRDDEERGHEEKTDPGKKFGQKFGKKGKGGDHQGGDQHDKDDKDRHDKDDDDHEHGKGGQELTDEDVDQIGERVQDGKGDKRLMKLARSVDDVEDVPGWAEDEDLWHKAVGMLEDRMDEFDEPAAVVVHVYQELGGEIEGDDEGGGKDKGGDHEEPDEDD